jgi:hypothetical protein
MLDTTGKFTKKTDVNAFDNLLILILAPIFAAILCFVNAFVISKLWDWYIVSFFNTKPLPLAMAFGIRLLFLYLYPVNYQHNDYNSKVVTATEILKPVITLLIGWAGTYFL